MAESYKNDPNETILIDDLKYRLQKFKKENVKSLL